VQPVGPLDGAPELGLGAASLCNVTRPGLGREGGVTVTGLVTGLTFVLYKEKEEEEEEEEEIY
jgi:hypothetical protein